MTRNPNDNILYGKYLLLEDRHVSYLVDSKVYDNLFVIIRNLCYNEKFQNAYILKKVYTGWAYYPSLKQFIKKSHSREHQPGAFMIYLTPNPLLKGIMSTQETISETDLRRPDFINIFINPNDLRDLYFEIFSDVRKNSMIKVKSVADDEFRSRVIGYLDHEFLHIRQMYMTKSGKSALTHQGDQKNELSDYLNNL